MAPDEGGAKAAASPFTAAVQDSPFAVMDGGAESGPEGFGKPGKLPERRKSDSPFQMAEPSEGFGFEAHGKSSAAKNPFEAAPAQSAPPASPFSTPAQAAPASPFSAEPQRGASPSPQAAHEGFRDWQEPAAQAPPFSSGNREPSPAQVPSVFAPAQTPAVAHAQSPAHDPLSDSFHIRQLELRAIFGVDREMDATELLQRARALPGMRNIARVGSQDMATVESLRNLLPRLGFGNGPLKLVSGAVPLEFIREGSVMLAVQTDGGFAPGVRETLMIVARELGRIS